MEDLRQLVQEEGREARNIVAFHVTVDTPASRISRKPPLRTGTSVGGVSALQRKVISGSGTVSAAGARRGARSASAGRDKRSELQARYWALLFGNLQRAVGEIYNTVEAHENLSECQEVILVLENYTRDFKALCEWFRLKWEYDNTPPPQRPLSLAWEVRKTDFVRPESRKTGSGKSSPSLSGKSSPSIAPGKVSPKILKQGCMSPKSPQNKEFSVLKYGVKNEKITEETPPKKDTIAKEADISNPKPITDDAVVELGTAIEYPTLPAPKKVTVIRQVTAKGTAPKASAESSKPAYSQAAAKPKTDDKNIKPSGNRPRQSVRTSTKADGLTRSKTMGEIRKAGAANQTKTQSSYPFNSTMGRSKLFEREFKSNRTNAPKFERSVPTRTQPKLTAKSQPPAKNPIVKSAKPAPELNSSSDTVVSSSVDVSRIQSNESLKTLVAGNELSESIEVLRDDDNAEDGWLTVKSRKLSKGSQPKKALSYWTDRFNQPSATASLPTLTILDSPTVDPKPHTVDKDRISKPETTKKLIEKPKDRPLIVRQRSDIVRSKTKNLIRKKLASYDKNLFKKRLHSSLESLDTVQTENDDSSKLKSFKCKHDSFRRSDRYLSNTNYIKKADLLEIAAMTSQIEENERKISIALDLQSEEDQRKLSEEEERLNQEIKELQQCDIDVDTETDDTETDAEIICEELNAPEETAQSADEELDEDREDLEVRYEPVLAGLSWADRVHTLAALEALVARHPGRAQQLHVKLSQGMRRRGSLQETLKRYQQKQERAQQQRQELQDERAKKLHQLLARVEDVKTAKNQLIEEKRLRMEQRLQKAAENRDQHLKDIVRKAHDEDEKLREILFIKQLQAEQARHEILAQVRRHTSRMRQLRRERLRRLEQLVARRAAAGARRSALEAARGGRLRALQERRRLRHERATHKRDQVLSRSQRLGAALSNRQTVDNIHVELETLPKGKCEVRSKEHTNSRHGRKSKNISSERKKMRNGLEKEQSAEPSDKENCEDPAVSKESKEKAKAQKKKIRKFKQKILAKGEEYECSYEPPPVDQRLCSSSKLLRPIQHVCSLILSPMDTLNRQIVPPDKSEFDGKSSSTHSSRADLTKITSKRAADKERGGANRFERSLSELARALQKKNLVDKVIFLKLGGFNAIGGILTAAIEGDCSDKTVMTAAQIISNILSGFPQGCEFFVRSNRMVSLLTLLSQKMVTDKSMQLSCALAECASIPFELINSRKADAETVNPDLVQRIHQMVGYACASGVVSSTARHNNMTSSFHRLIAALAEASLTHKDDYTKSHFNDNTARGNMARELRAAELCGALAALQDETDPSNDKDPTAHDTEELGAALRLLNAAARVDIHSYQEILGGETQAIQFRTAVSRLLAKYAPSEIDLIGGADGERSPGIHALLCDLIAAIGYFVVNNEKNQEVLSGGEPPGSACARRLAALPAQLCTPGRAADPRVPLAIAALAACPRARTILTAEINVQVLEEFVRSDTSKDTPLAIMMTSPHYKLNGVSDNRV